MSCRHDTAFLMLKRLFFFFNDTATTEIYTLSLHDALPISAAVSASTAGRRAAAKAASADGTSPQCASSARASADRKSTRLNSSHANISYAVFCLKKKNTQNAAEHTDNNKARYYSKVHVTPQ